MKGTEVNAVRRVLIPAIVSALALLGCTRTWSPDSRQISEIFANYSPAVQESAMRGRFVLRSRPGVPSVTSFMGWSSVSAEEKQSIMAAMEYWEDCTLSYFAKEVIKCPEKDALAILISNYGFSVEEVAAIVSIDDWMDRIVCSHRSRDTDSWPWGGYAFISQSSDVVFWVGMRSDLADD